MDAEFEWDGLLVFLAENEAEKNVEFHIPSKRQASQVARVPKA